MMKKILTYVVFIGAFAALSVKAESYLYWMTPSTKDVGEYTYANLYLDQGSGDRLDLGYVAAGSEAMWSDPWATPASGTDTTTWAFYIELLNSDFDTVKTATITYSDAAYAILSEGTTPGADFGAFAAPAAMFNNVPEPTSGLLMLLGICGLALKRKHR